MFKIIFIGLIILIISLVILWYIIQGPFIIALGKIPGPKPLPIIGNIHHLSNDTTKIIPKLLKLKKEYGTIFKIFIGFQETIVVISDVKLLEIILGTTKQLNKSRFYKFLFNWMGYGLLTASNDTIVAEKWPHQRKLITPAFHFKMLEQFLEIFHKNIKILLEKLESELHGYSFDIYKYVTLMALDNIIETAMNTKINAQNDENSMYVESVRGMTAIITKRQYDIITGSDILYKFTDTYSKEKLYLSVLHGLTEKVIEQRKQEIINNPNNENNSDKKKTAFLDLLLKSTLNGRPLSDTELRDEVDTFLFEGHDTTSSTISFTLYCLSKHPDVQGKLMEEIFSVYENDKQRISTYAELQNMKYLDAVIKEVLRLFPAAPVIAREIHNDFEYDGVKYPPHTTMQIFIYGVMRDPQFFEDPEKFNPERFLFIEDLNPYAYIPFSAGPRNCIGQKYALLAIKSTIVEFMKTYEILDAFDCSLDLSFDLVLKSHNGIKIRIKKRKYV